MRCFSRARATQYRLFRWVRLIAALAILWPAPVWAAAQTDEPSPAPRRHRLTWAPAGWPLPATIATPQTVFYAVPAPDDAYAIRVITVTLPTVGGNTLGPILYRPSSDWGREGDPYVNPTDPGCAMGGACWAQVTFNAAGADSDGIRDCCMPATLVMPTLVSPDPTTGSTQTARLVYSDWNSLAPLPPSGESAAPRVVMLRVVEPAGTLVRLGAMPGDTKPSGAAWTGNREMNHGYDYSIRSKPGTVTFEAGVTGTQPGAQGPLWAVQFLTRNPGVQITIGGDSHMMGLGTTANMASFALRAAVVLSTQAVPVMLANAGWTGAGSDQFLPLQLDAIAATQPSICLIQTWTAADQRTPQGMARTLGRALAVAQRCGTLGARAVFVTPFPRDAATLTGPVLTAWQALYGEVTGMNSAATRVLDLTRVLGDFRGGRPTGAFRPGFSDDSIHPNDAGTTAAVPATEAIIRVVGGL